MRLWDQAASNGMSPRCGALLHYHWIFAQPIALNIQLERVILRSGPGKLRTSIRAVIASKCLTGHRHLRKCICPTALPLILKLLHQALQPLIDLPPSPSFLTLRTKLGLQVCPHSAKHFSVLARDSSKRY